MNASEAQPQFMLLLRLPGEGSRPSDEELRQIMERFAVWMKSLADRGMVLGTNGLEETGTVLRGSLGATTVTDGPFAEAKEIIGGYVLITAASFEQAVEAARACPGLDYRMAVEVRPVKTIRSPGG